MSLPHPEASYVASVVTLYLEMPDTPMRVSASDQWLARHFHQDSVSLETVENSPPARLTASPDPTHRCPTTRSHPLARILPTSHRGIQENPAPENYREYLRLKLRHVATDTHGK